MRIWTRTLCLAALLLAAVPALHAQSPAPQLFGGVWIFRATFPGAPQPVYIGTGRFHQDGSLSGPPNSQLVGPAVGEWTRTRGQELVFTFVANTYDPESGNLATTNRVRGMMTVSNDGRTATGRTLVDIMDPAGNVIMSRSAVFTGTRVVVEPF